MGSFLKRVFPGVYFSDDAKRGYEKFKSLSPEIVISDLTLPGKNPFEMIVDMKLLNKDIYIILLSENTKDMELLKSPRYGDLFVFDKTF